MRFVRWTIVVFAMVLVGLAAYSIAATLEQSEAQNPGKSQTIVPIPTLTAGERDRLYQPGRPWDGIGKGLTEAEARSFAEFPLVRFGPTFAGYNLQTIQHEKWTSPPGPPPQTMNRVTFIYGDCTPDSGQPSCSVPAYIHVQPTCAVKPDIVEPNVKDGELRSLPGGAQLQRFSDGHVLLWTGDVLLDIGSSAQSGITDLDLASLRLIANDSVLTGSSLTAPNLGSC